MKDANDNLRIPDTIYALPADADHGETDPDAEPAPCEHYRLNEDGTCRFCGEDRRGI